MVVVSAATPVRPYLRTELIIERQQDGETLHYLVKDPTNGKYWQCGTSLYALLCLCDGQSTVDELLARYTQETQIMLRPEQLDFALERFAVQGFFQRSDGVPVAPAPPRLLRLWRLLNPGRFTRRWRLFPTGPLLQPLTTSLRWLLAPPFLVGYGVLMLAALWILWQGGWNDGVLIVVMQLYAEVSLVTWGQFLVMLFLVMLVHESAHGMVLQRFGRQPGYFGVAICPWAGIFCYVEIGEIWRLSSRRERVAVSLAGPAASMLCGSVGALAWALLGPASIFVAWAAALMVAGVLTALYNLFPIFRTDGYFALSDWLRLPNLDSKSYAFLWQLFSRPFVHRQVERRPLAHQLILAVYGIASALLTLWVLFVAGEFLLKVVVFVVSQFI